MKTILFLILFGLISISPSIANAFVIDSYVRTPSGLNISSGEEIVVEYEVSEMQNDFPPYSGQVYVHEEGNPIDIAFGACVNYSEETFATGTVSDTLPDGVYTALYLLYQEGSDCVSMASPEQPDLEGDESEPIFIISEDEPEFGTTTVAAVLGSTVTGFGVSALTILAAVIGIAVALLVVRWGWLQMSGSNLPGSPGYDSMRGSGASRNNRARMESQGSSGKKVNLLE